jgi:hypothetical protein
MKARLKILLRRPPTKLKPAINTRQSKTAYRRENPPGVKAPGRPSPRARRAATPNSAAITRPARPEAPRIQIARDACPCSAMAVLAHANTSSFSSASPCVMDEPCFAVSEATGHAPSATKAHVTGLGIALCNALPEFAPQ